MKRVMTMVFTGAAAMILAGCVHTVTDSHTFATTWNTDMVSGRYARTPDQVYRAALKVVQNDGVLLNEYIPHDSTNLVKALDGRVNDKKVYIRVEAVDQRTTQVDVQARSNWGMTDVNLVHELEKEIALQLAQAPVF